MHVARQHTWLCPLCSHLAFPKLADSMVQTMDKQQDDYFTVIKKFLLTTHGGGISDCPFLLTCIVKVSYHLALLS